MSGKELLASHTPPEEPADGRSNHNKKQRKQPEGNGQRRRAFAGLAYCLGAAVIAASAVGWLAFTASKIKSELVSVESLAPQFQRQLMEQDDAAARHTLDLVRAHADNAVAGASDPLWKAAGGLPWLGANFSAVSEMALSTDDVVKGTAEPLLRASSAMALKDLKLVHGRLDMEPLQKSAPSIVSAANTLELTYARLKGIDTTKLLPEISGSLTAATRSLDEQRGTLTALANAVRVLPTMLGSTDERNYLLLVQNSAEIRATGGLPGALAVIRIKNGNIELTEQSSGSALGKYEPPIPVDPAQTQIFTGRLGTYISDVNLTPDFPTAARSAKAMWEKRHSTTIDGVVAIDPVVLANLLKATGPLSLPADVVPEGSHILPRQLTQANVVKTLLSDVYSEIESNQLQDAYFASVSREVFQGLTSGRASGEAITQALVKSADENRLLIWSVHDEEQDILGSTPIGGSTAGKSVGGASFGLYFNDGTGAKMDYYVKRTAQLVGECTADGYSRMKVRVTLRNTAPSDAATALPEAVTGGGRYGVPPGTVQTNVVVYGPSQAQIETASQDGKKTPFGAHFDNDRPVGTLTTQVGPGQSQTVEFTFGKIVQQVEPVLVLTPTIQAMRDVLQMPELANCS